MSRRMLLWSRSVLESWYLAHQRTLKLGAKEITLDSMISSSRLSLYNIRNLPTTPLFKKFWPPALSDEYASSSIEEFSPTYEDIKSQVENVGHILIRIVTWNQQAREPPSPEELAKHLFPSRRYHIIAVGTQECQNTFAKSILNPSKAKWEERLEAALGTDFDAVHSHSLQASHMWDFFLWELSLFSHIKSLFHSRIQNHFCPQGHRSLGIQHSLAGDTDWNWRQTW